MPDIKAQAQTLLRPAQSPTGDGGANITAAELGTMKSAIASSTHPRLLSDELNKASSNLTGPQQQELQTYADKVTNTRASAAQSGFDVLSALNNINRINPLSWLVNWHAPFTKPQ